MGSPGSARADWETRIGRRGADVTSQATGLAAPTGLRVVPGRGQVTLHWDPVPEPPATWCTGPPAPAHRLSRSTTAAVMCSPYQRGLTATPVPDSERTGYYAVAAVSGPSTAGPLSVPESGELSFGFSLPMPGVSYPGARARGVTG